MFVRLKFPTHSADDVYLIVYEYQFSVNNSYDIFELSQIFSQSPILMLILGSQKSFTLSGSLFIKRQGGSYIVDGLYNNSFGYLTFTTIRQIIQFFDNVTKSWNNGINNILANRFKIAYVDPYNENIDENILENFLPESFSYSFSSRDPMLITVTISGKIGKSITSS